MKTIYNIPWRFLLCGIYKSIKLDKVSTRVCFSLLHCVFLDRRYLRMVTNAVLFWCSMVQLFPDISSLTTTHAIILSEV